MNEIDLTPLIAALAELFPEVEPAQCRNCQSREVHAKGLCGTCYYRWDYAGRPERVPEAWAAVSQARRDRIEDYAFMLANGESRVAAARRLGGLSERTLRQYDAELTEMDEAA